MASVPKLLIALPDRVLADLLAEHATTCGYQPFVFGNGNDALASAKERKPDIAIIAQLLPGKDGVEVCKDLQFDGELPIILVAAVGLTSALNEVRKASKARVVVPRNFRHEALIREFDILAGVAPAAPEKPAPTTPRPVLNIKETVRRPRGDHPMTLPPPAPAGPVLEGVPPSFAPKSIVTSQAVGNTPIAAFEPAAFLAKQLRDGVSGALRIVSRQGIERIVHLQNGRPIAATSNLTGDRIGEILVRKGLITPKDLDEALAHGKTNGTRLGQSLVDLGILAFERQRAEVAEQYAMRILSLFGLSEASVELQARGLSDENIPVELPPERVVIEGLRRYYPASRLETVIGSGDRVLRTTPDFWEKLPLLSMTAAESAVLPSLDGNTTIATICAGLEDRTAGLRALYACVVLGLAS